MLMGALRGGASACPRNERQGFDDSAFELGLDVTDSSRQLTPRACRSQVLKTPLFF